MNEVLTQTFNSNKGQDGLLDQPGFKIAINVAKVCLSEKKSHQHEHIVVFLVCSDIFITISSI